MVGLGVVSPLPGQNTVKGEVPPVGKVKACPSQMSGHEGLMVTGGSNERIGGSFRSSLIVHKSKSPGANSLDESITVMECEPTQRSENTFDAPKGLGAGP